MGGPRPDRIRERSDTPVKLCLRCGSPLPKGRRRYCSDECSRAAETERAASQYTPPGPRPGVYRDNMTCETCGVTYRGHIRSKRCPACQADKQRRDNAEYKRRAKAGKTRQIGSTDLCAQCGQPYIVSGSLQRYCPDCAAEAVLNNSRASRRAWNKDYYADPANRARKASARRIKDRLTYTCAICGKEFFAPSGTVTCSDECRAIYRSQYMQAYDADRAESRREYNKSRYAQRVDTPDKRAEYNRRQREAYARRKAAKEDTNA